MNHICWEIVAPVGFLAMAGTHFVPAMGSVLIGSVLMESVPDSLGFPIAQRGN